MIGYVTLGTNDLEGSAPFYDALAKELGGSRQMEFPGFIAWGGAGPMVSLIKPYDGKAASVGNGVMVGLAAASKELAGRSRFTPSPLANGGILRRASGGSVVTGFTLAYFRDREGHKLNAFYSGVRSRDRCGRSGMEWPIA